MGSKTDKSEPNSTPKLYLYSLPTKPPEPPGLLTPPLHTLASIPFQWEEAPGKPRTTAGAAATPPCKSKTARSLELPPRLMTENSKITHMPSPTTVLDGPNPAQFRSNTMSFGSPIGSFRSAEEIGRRESRERVRFSSWRWGGDISGISGGSSGSLDFSTSYVSDPKVKISRVRRKGSFLRFSNTSNSSLLGNIYESFKKVVPWKRRQAKSRNVSF